MKRLVVLVLLIAGCGYGASRGLDYWNTDVNTPVSSTSHPVNFKISPGEAPGEVSSDLEAKGLIRSAQAFDWYLKFSNRRGDLQAGDFVLNRNMTVPQIVDALQHGKIDQVSVNVPEGIATKFVADAIQKSGFASAADYLAAEKDPAWTAQYDFLAGKPATRDLEGYLFPDTYSLNRGATAKDLVKAQLDAFGRNFTPDMRQAIAQPTAARPAMTIDKIVILASLVDREVNREAEKPRVCEVFYNRIRDGERLDVDATILYALGVLKKDITQDDLNLNSPYNTRKFAGLPPGPIGNPTLSAIKGCVSPEKNDYLFYFTDKGGSTHFETNINQFNADIQKYGVSGQ